MIEFDLAAPPPGPPAAVPEPIADLSYRNYDGPLRAHTIRWWVVALATIRPLKKKALFWISVALALLPYVIFIFTVYTKAQITNTAQKMPSGFGGMMAHEPWANTFFSAVTTQDILLLLAAVVIGSGVVSSDNRANALQVYLSKPITKADYVIGKWIGVFVPVYVLAAGPLLLLYFFSMLIAPSHEVWNEDRLMLLRLLLAAAIPAVLHASLLVGFSSWTTKPLLAGGLYFGLYFLSLALVVLAVGIQTDLHKSSFNPQTTVVHYSMPGLIDGLVQNVLHVSVQSGTFNRHSGAVNLVLRTPPNPGPMALILVTASVLGVLAARWKIRAVEVVRG